MALLYESEWNQQYDPVVNRYVTAGLAAVPIAFFLVALTVIKMKGLHAAIITLILQAAVAQFVFKMPLVMIGMSAAYGIASGLWPICYIIIAAVWLYKIAIRSGKFAIIRSSVASISDDSRIQVILIAFCFGGFLEGAAAFGTPIAICAAMLTELGFKPLKATCLSLVANAAVGSYGAIGIPIIVGAQQADVNLSAMSRSMIPTAQIAVVFIPLIMIGITDGWRGIKQTAPVWLSVGLVNSLVQCATLYWLGPELTNIGAALVSMLVLIGLTRVWSPSYIYREGEDDGGSSHGDLEAQVEIAGKTIELVAPLQLAEEAKVISRQPSVNQEPQISVNSVCVKPAAVEEEATPTSSKRDVIDIGQLGAWEILKAWSPFLLLTIVILIWSIEPFKQLFAPGGLLADTVIKVPIPFLHNTVVQTPPIKDGVMMPAIWPLTFINASGTALVLSILLTIVTTRRITFKKSFQELGKTCKELWRACVMICLVMAVAYVANFCGASACMGLAISGAGSVFPLFCPVVGWLGVFITGSVVNNNVLFARLQAVTAAQIGVNPTLLVAANTAGGTMGKAVSPQSIAIAAAAVGMIGREADIMKGTLKHSLLLTAAVCACSYVSSLLIPA